MKALIPALSIVLASGCAFNPSLTNMVQSKDKKLDLYKNEYITSLEAREAPSFMLEADFKESLPLASVPEGKYAHHIDHVDDDGIIDITETIDLSMDGNLSFTVIMSRQRGKSYGWSASGNYKVEGEVLNIYNPSGDLRILTKEASINKKSRCIIMSISKNGIMLACHARSYNKGGDLFRKVY